MPAAAYVFGPFVLDPGDRRLLRDGEPVEVSARYFDALTLLAAENGRLVTKERFHDEVWRGIPVTDEALTQCIRSLRRALDDDAAAPRYIETVPRHGYRFIAPVQGESPPPAPMAPADQGSSSLLPLAQDVAAAALGGGTAGIVGGLLYLSAGLVTPAMGAASTLLVLISINLTLGLVAGGAVGLGIAAFQRTGPGAWRVLAGGAVGGLVVGALAHMIGNDLFELLFGRSPGAITGGGEGAVLGFAVAGGTIAAQHFPPDKLWARTFAGFATGGLAGAAIALTGGKLMAGSLAQLAQRFPDSRLGFDRTGTLLAHEGQIGLGVATTLEGALFAGFAVCALLFAQRLRAAKA
jgi:DNA-binding winged helix-turn-helix (wHTH) protein